MNTAASGQAPATAIIGIATLAERLCDSERHIRRLVAERRIPFLRSAATLGSTVPRSPAGSTTAASR